MPNPNDAIVRRARSLVGSRYRPQGRNAEDGTDCVGVVLCAFGLESSDVPSNYARRCFDLDALLHILRGAGLVPIEGEPGAGDLLIFSPGPCNLHLAVHVGRAFVHADAQLRRVVERPLPAPWPLVAAQRLDSNS